MFIVLVIIIEKILIFSMIRSILRNLLGTVTKTLLDYAAKTLSIALKYAFASS